MAKTRTQKAMLNTVTGALAEVVLLICGLILPRLILARFGSSYNGITQSAKQYLSAITILNVGVTGATKVALYKPLAENNIEKISGIVKALDRQMRKVGMILSAYIVVLIFAYPLLVDTGYSWIEVAPLVLAAGISALGSYFFGITYSTLLTADQNVYILNAFSIIATILNTVVNVILIKAGCSIQVVRISGAVVLFLRPLLLNLYAKKRYKLIQNCEPDNTGMSMRRDVLAHSIANIVHDHTDLVVITLFTNAKMASVYTVYNLVMAILKKTQRIFTNGTESIFGSMWSKGEMAKIRHNLSIYEFIVGSFASVVFSTTLVMILPFITLYTKGVKDVEYIRPAYALIITVAQAFYCVRAPYTTLVHGSGHYKETKVGAYMEAGINLVLSVVLIQFIGIAGVALGTLAANVFRTVQYAIYVDKNLVPRGIRFFGLHLLWATLNAVIIFFLSKLLPLVGKAYDSWLLWITAAIVVTLLAFAVTALSAAVFYRKDMMGVVKMLKRLRR